MEIYVVLIIVCVIILIIAIVAIANKENYSKTNINGKLHILSEKSIPLKNGKEAYFSLSEKGINILQGTVSIDIPFGAIYEVKSSNFSQIVNKDKSVVGRAAVGGLLFGEIGAIIGGMSGLQQGQEHVGGDLFIISFNYAEFGKTILGIRVENGVIEFLNKYDELSGKHKIAHTSTKKDIYSIGSFKASQMIGEERSEFIYDVKYEATDQQLIINIDARNANFCLYLNPVDKAHLQNLFRKVIDWKNKALEAKLSAEKEVGSFNADISLNYDNNQHFVNNGNIIMNFDCWFEGYDPKIDINEDEYCLISISSPNINISGDNIEIPAAIIGLKINEIGNLLNIISDDYIKNKRVQLDDDADRIDQILN